MFRLSMKKTGILLTIIFAVFCLSPLFGTDRQPINVNLIIDGSSSFTAVKGEIITWINRRIDQLLVNGDRVTVWSAETVSRVVYSGTINGPADRDAVKAQIREISGTGETADFSRALREASAGAGALSGTPFSYTLLINASPGTLSSILSGPDASQLRFSRIEEFPGWRAFVVGLNIDSRVRRAASAFMN